MCDIIDLSVRQPHISVLIDGNAYIVPAASIRDLANGHISIAEFHNAEAMARLMAIALIERL